MRTVSGGGSAPHPTEFLRHACENITFPKLLLRTVKIDKKDVLRVLLVDSVSWDV